MTLKKRISFLQIVERKSKKMLMRFRLMAMFFIPQLFRNHNGTAANGSGHPMSMLPQQYMQQQQQISKCKLSVSLSNSLQCRPTFRVQPDFIFS